MIMPQGPLESLLTRPAHEILNFNLSNLSTTKMCAIPTLCIPDAMTDLVRVREASLPMAPHIMEDKR